VIKHIKKALSLFSKKKEEIDPATAEAWPFPVVIGTPPAEAKPEKKKPTVKKATTRTKKPAVVAKTVAKKAKTVAKKTTKAKKK
jgi:hypothetical protein